tara:strand:- start:36275 stop:36802 length:528 start_codon:yes stop_codon:yes gene_type:complete
MSINKWLTIGIVIGIKGLKGAIRIKPQSDFPERFTKHGTRWLQRLDEDPRKIILLNGKKQPGKEIYIINIEGLNSREKAENIIGDKLLVKSSNLPSLQEDEFHYLQLINLSLKTSEEGSPIGTIIDLRKYGNDLLLAKLKSGKEVLIPFVKDIVPKVNIKEGWILVKPPKGLFDL